MTEFKRALNEWLVENGFDCDICIDSHFGYDLCNNILHIGCNDFEYDWIFNWYEQFLYEYGAEYIGIYGPVLAFIHELGHVRTLSHFTDSELISFNVFKFFLETRMDYQEEMITYWEIPDEFAANVWAIDFINAHIEAVDELSEIFVKRM